MDAEPQQSPVAILNKLRKATEDGRLLWERYGDYGSQYRAVLPSGYTVVVARAPAGDAVIVTMTSPEGRSTLHLDSGRAGDDLLRLALLQLYVSVRDTVAALITKEAYRAVEDL